MSVARTLAVLGALGVPALLAPALVAAREKLRSILWKACALFICAFPLVTPWLVVGQLRPLFVWLLGVAGGIVTLKAADWLARPRRENEPVCVWLALSVWPALQIEDVAIPERRIAERIGPVLSRFAAAGTGLLSGLALAALGQSLDLPRRGLLWDSSFKALEIYLLAGGANHLLVGTFALAGYRVLDAFRYPILAHSVLDFWSRYKVWIHRWLKRHVFEPFGRRWRTPVLGILAAFTISGLLHEYLVVPVAPELLGWQLAFFGVHGAGAIAGAWMGAAYRSIARRRVPRPLAISATISFVLLTAPLFIHCMDSLFDLHRDLGGWVLSHIPPPAITSGPVLPVARVSTSALARDPAAFLGVPCADALDQSGPSLPRRGGDVFQDHS